MEWRKEEERMSSSRSHSVPPKLKDPLMDFIIAHHATGKILCKISDKPLSSDMFDAIAVRYIDSLKIEFATFTHKHALLLIDAIKVNSNVTELVLDELRGLDDNAVEKLVSKGIAFSEITTLTLSSIAVGSRGFKAIANLIRSNQTIVRLSLVNCPIDARSVVMIGEALGKNQFLTHLRLSGCLAEEEAVSNLLELLQSNKIVTNLDLSNNQFTRGSFKCLSDLLQINQSIEKLLLHNVDMDVEKASILASGLKDNHGVSALGLSANKLGCIGSAKVLESFGCRAKDLNLSRLGIQKECSEQLAKALMSCTNLETLHLSNNDIREEVISSICYLLSFQNLIYLNLMLNPIGDVSLAKLGAALVTNWTLRELYLIGCEANFEVLMQFFESLKSNHAIQSLYVRVKGVQFSTEQSSEIAHVLSFNTSLLKLELSSSDQSEIHEVLLRNAQLYHEEATLALLQLFVKLSSTLSGGLLLDQQAMLFSIMQYYHVEAPKSAESWDW